MKRSSLSPVGLVRLWRRVSRLWSLLAFFLVGAAAAQDELSGIASTAVTEVNGFGDTYKLLIAAMAVLALAGLGFWFLVATIRNRSD
jgi:hypothetical protein